jgi:hypothetical protein
VKLRLIRIVGSSLEVELVVDVSSPQLAEILANLQQSTAARPDVTNYDALEELLIVSSVQVQVSPAVNVAADVSPDADVLSTDGVVPLPDGMVLKPI